MQVGDGHGVVQPRGVPPLLPRPRGFGQLDLEEERLPVVVSTKSVFRKMLSKTIN